LKIYQLDQYFGKLVSENSAHPCQNLFQFRNTTKPGEVHDNNSTVFCRL